ncbi:MAG: N-acetylmannosamine-6-phosphate 2-epimerase [Victivallales bacterium]
MIPETVKRLKNKLIVSCQAAPGEPLYGPAFMAAMAKSAELAGAGAVRINGAADIAATRQAVNIPVIGILKRQSPETRAYITPDFRCARQLVEAGADIVALDATNAFRTEPLEELIFKITNELKVPVFADVSNFSEGIKAAAYGAAIVASTLSGYKTYNAGIASPDFKLITRLAVNIAVPVVCEGLVNSPEEAARALRAGAWAVVVGTAITRPREIAAKFAAAMKAEVPA